MVGILSEMDQGTSHNELVVGCTTSMIAVEVSTMHDLENFCAYQQRGAKWMDPVANCLNANLSSHDLSSGKLGEVSMINVCIRSKYR